MIYTITFNPSLDYIMDVDNFEEGKTNRSFAEYIYSGGKGINVSIMLRNLGLDSVAFGFIAGFTGEEIQRQLAEANCQTDFIKLKKGISRINIKLRSGKESEINAIGPIIENEELKMLFEKLNKLEKGDILVISGSIPNSIPNNIYERIMEHLKNNEIKIVVDATKDLLLNVLKYKPFLIKPNNHELEELFLVKLELEEDIIKYAKKLQEMGAQNVLVSMAGDGAILVTQTGKVYKSKAHKGSVINSVGAGDSMVAGFLAGYIDSNDYEIAFVTGVAAGSASAFSQGFGDYKLVSEFMEKNMLY